MSALTTGSKLDVKVLGLPGVWTVWSQAGDGPGAHFVVPADDDAQAVGVKYAVVRAVMGRTSTKPALELVRTDPPRNDLVDADQARRKNEKRKRP